MYTFEVKTIFMLCLNQKILKGGDEKCGKYCTKIGGYTFWPSIPGNIVRYGRGGWNFPDISGGIETAEVIFEWIYGKVVVGISQTSVVGLRQSKDCPRLSFGFDTLLEFPRHQWWD